MALCPYCFEDIQTRHTRAVREQRALQVENFASHIARCPDAPPEAKAAWRAGWPDYLRGAGPTARREA